MRAVYGAVLRSCRNFYSAVEGRIAQRIITLAYGHPPMWPDARLLDLLGIEHPIIQAPMAGAVSPEMVIQVSEAGGLGSLPCAMLTPDQARNDLGVIRQRTSRPVNLNFFCHTPPRSDPAMEARWRDRLRPYYAELGIDADAPNPAAIRNPFDDAFCRVVEEFKPEAVSFHFGLPTSDLLQRVKATGARVLSSANSVREARWLEERGCDAIIAQGFEAGGHQAMFLSHDRGRGHRRRARHRRRIRVGCLGRSDRHGLPSLP
jgi:nitronate monooxygenase